MIRRAAIGMTGAGVTMSATIGTSVRSTEGVAPTAMIPRWSWPQGAGIRLSRVTGDVVWWQLGSLVAAPGFRASQDVAQ